jgi:hypothetical protein
MRREEKRRQERRGEERKRGRAKIFKEGKRQDHDIIQCKPQRLLCITYLVPL